MQPRIAKIIIHQRFLHHLSLSPRFSLILYLFLNLQSFLIDQVSPDLEKPRNLKEFFLMVLVVIYSLL